MTYLVAAPRTPAPERAPQPHLDRGDQPDPSRDRDQAPERSGARRGLYELRFRVLAAGREEEREQRKRHREEYRDPEYPQRPACRAFRLALAAVEPETD